MFNFMLKQNIQNFIGVPDSTMKYFIDQGIRKRKILITTREEEAIGIAAGMTLSKSSCLIFMQNAGFANSIGTITSLIQLYEIPVIFLIGWRGFLKNDAPEHLKIGSIQEKLLSTINLASRIVSDDNWKKNCEWSVKKIKTNSSCALIIRREFND